VTIETGAIVNVSTQTFRNRSDTDIFAEARRALDDTPTVPATVRVHIDDGLAWLTGLTRRWSERMEAERVVSDVPGVRQVINKITVAGQTGTGGL
jgi:osmotically-inducible protein OsmY